MSHLDVASVQAVCARCQGYGIEPRRCVSCREWSEGGYRASIEGGRDCTCEPLGALLRWMYDHRALIRCEAPDWVRVDGQCEALAEFRLTWTLRPHGMRLCLAHAQHVVRLKNVPEGQSLTATRLDYEAHGEAFQTHWASARVLRRAIG